MIASQFHICTSYAHTRVNCDLEREACSISNSQEVTPSGLRPGEANSKSSRPLLLTHREHSASSPLGKSMSLNPSFKEFQGTSQSTSPPSVEGGNGLDCLPGNLLLTGILNAAYIYHETLCRPGGCVYCLEFVRGIDVERATGQKPTHVPPSRGHFPGPGWQELSA